MPDDFAPTDRAVDFVAPAWVNRTADWIKRNARGVLSAAIVFQLLVLVSMIVVQAAPLAFGERILLKVRPVDPRDLFRGDYVVLSYDFSRIPLGGIAGAPSNPFGQQNYAPYDPWWQDRPVYVSLEKDPDGKHYRATGVSVVRPTSARYIKGKFARGWMGNDLQFGIEAYYVQEGEGRVLEQLRNSGQLSAEIALAPWGQAKLCGLK